MTKKDFRFSDHFVQKLVEITDGAVASDIFEKLLQNLESEASKYYFNSTSEANLLRIFTSIYDRASFMREITDYPHHGEMIIAISGSSNYLTDIVVRNPEYLYQLFDQEYLIGKLKLESLKSEISSGASKFKSLAAKLNYLRQVKKRFILKIGLNDILGVEDLLTTTEQLSSLAIAINTILFGLCFDEVLARHNLKIPADKYCLSSLGKLGGNELNYSSDVDFILFYDSVQMPEGFNLEYHEILSESTLLFIKSSTDISERGYIYRVDFRLRPDGKYSPLCKLLSDYIRYYESRGEDWERQMLIKLGFVCGNEDLYRRFFTFVQSYTYQTSFADSVKEKIRIMKQNIERQHAEKENVKTFRGGIRDIEFTVQALQLLNGGRIKSLRGGNTLKMIQSLASHNLLTAAEEKIFTEAYIFYRRIEHFLQLMNDTQTHIIPNEHDLQFKLAKYLGLDSPEELKQRLFSFRENVRRIYESVLNSGNQPAGGYSLLSVGFKDKSKAERNIKFLRSGVGLIGRKEFDSRTIELFNTLEPFLLSFLKNAADPDKTLDNFVKVISFTKFPSIWYTEFQNRKIYNNFLKLCLFSQRAIDMITLSRILEEDFISHKVFLRNYRTEIGKMNTGEMIFLASVQFTYGLIDSRMVSKIFNLFIYGKLKKLCEEFSFGYKYCVCGLGSFGAESMNFASDVDLLIIVENIQLSESIQTDFQKFLGRVNETLSPFNADCRLRPEGKKSQLVWDLENYREYLHTRARVWEFQTLLKLRFVHGDENLFNNFRKIIINEVKNLNGEFVKKEMLQMYSTLTKHTIRSGFHIKKERGGGITIDFLLQFLILNDPKLYAKLQGKSIRGIISSLKKRIGDDDSVLLKNNFNFLKDMEIAVQNIFNTNHGIVPSDQEKRNLVAAFFHMTGISELDKRISSIVKSNNSLFEKHLPRQNENH